MSRTDGEEDQIAPWIIGRWAGTLESFFDATGFLFGRTTSRCVSLIDV